MLSLSHVWGISFYSFGTIISIHEIVPLSMYTNAVVPGTLKPTIVLMDGNADFQPFFFIYRCGIIIQLNPTINKWMALGYTPRVSNMVHLNSSAPWTRRFPMKKNTSVFRSTMLVFWGCTRYISKICNLKVECSFVGNYWCPSKLEPTFFPQQKILW